jgi:hypothetical protein
VLLKSDFENMQFPSNQRTPGGNPVLQNHKTALNLHTKKNKYNTKPDTSQYQDHDWGVAGFEKALDFRFYFPQVVVKFTDHSTPAASMNLTYEASGVE